MDNNTHAVQHGRNLQPSRKPSTNRIRVFVRLAVLLQVVVALMFHNSAVTRTMMNFDDMNLPILKKQFQNITSRHIDDVVSISRAIPLDTSSSISAALCYKTLFGAVDLDRVLKWVAYNRMLGFDHVFLWYLPYIAEYPGFDELNSLPYVTLMVNTDAEEREVMPNYTRLMKKDGGIDDLDQYAREAECLGKVAKDYDWVLFADADEYLWFRDKMGIKDFLTRNNEYHYISFGKYMYTLNHRVDMHDTGFGLDMFPFTAGSYCNQTSPTNNLTAVRGHPICPLVQGRAKVIVKPSIHAKYGLHVHGRHIPHKQLGTIHFSTSLAHFKEWPWIFRKHNATVRAKRNFTVSSGNEVQLHELETAHTPNDDDNSTWTMQYDDQLADWFQFVHQRGEAISDLPW